MDSRNSMFVLASDVLLAEQQTNNQFMTVKMRMLSTRANKNDQGVTEAFIDEIVANPEKYDCTPLYADKMNLLAGRYDRLGHKFNRATHTYGTDQIGSFALNAFEKVNDEFGTSLYGEVRIPKRESDICAAVQEMYERGIQNFSFEVTYSPDNVIQDGKVMYVDAAETNTLNGMAIVSVPAYPESVALDLVAEAGNEGDTDPTEMNSETEKPGTDTNEVNEEMDKVNEANASTVEEVMIDTASRQTVERVSGFEDEPNVAAEEDTSMNANAAEEDAKEPEEEKKPEEEKPEEEVPEEKKEEEEAKAEEAEAEEPAGKPEYNRVVETVEEEYITRITRMQETIAEKDAMIASLQEKVKDYEVIEAELKEYKEAAQKKEHEEKLNKATTYAETMGLNVEDEEVKNAIASLDYEKLVDLSVAVAQAKAKETENVEEGSPVGQIYSSYSGVIEDLTFGGIISGR